MEEIIRVGRLRRCLSFNTKKIPASQNTKLMPWLSYEIWYNNLVLYFSPKACHLGQYQVKILDKQYLILLLLRLEVEKFEPDKKLTLSELQE